MCKHSHLTSIRVFLFVCFFVLEVNWTAKEICHFCQSPHIKIQPITITHFYAQVCYNAPILMTCPKASDYLHNKEEIAMNHNLVTESKVTKCNIMSLTIVTLTSVLQALQEEWTGLRQMSFPEHLSEIPEMCPDTRRAHILLEMIVT